MKEIPQVGVALPRVDAPGKATGREKYAADHYPPSMLWAGVKRSEMPHARIRKIETAAAETLPGVVAVLTAKDVPGPNRLGLVKKDQEVLCTRKVRRVGDPLAFVLAEDRETLAQAILAIKVDLNPLPAVFDPEEALGRGAPVIHESSPGNLLARLRIAKGRGEEALDDCEVVVEGTFQVPRQEHAFLETENGYGFIDEAGRISLTVSTQSPHRDRLETAAALGLPPERVRVAAPYLGGAFGGKDGISVQALLALGLLHSKGRPVKMVWDREESFLAGFKRAPARMRYRLGADADGTLKAVSCRMVMDAGAYEHLAGEVLALGAEHAAGPYKIPHVFIDARSAYTNNPPTGPFRGFGMPQTASAMEQMVDMLALRLRVDPAALRRANVLHKGDLTPVGSILSGSVGLSECLDRLIGHLLWKEREAWKSRAGPFKRRGAGLACIWHGMGYGPLVADYATARIELTSEGRFRVDVGVPDMGQGNAATYLHVAADLLCQPPRAMLPVLPDTAGTLPCCSSAASRTTYTYVNALIGAAGEMKRRILEKASILSLSPSAHEFVLAPGSVRHSATGRDIPLPRLAAQMTPQERTAAYYWRAPTAKDRIEAEISSATGVPHRVFSFAAHLALVEVDELTGRVATVAYLAVTDAGRIINPDLYHGQVHGGVVQALGYALMEDFQVQNGAPLTQDFSTYITPTALDVPDLISLAVETHEETGPFGLKGVGELSAGGALPALANAVADACGRRVRGAPLTPERVLQTLHGKEPEGG